MPLSDWPLTSSFQAGVISFLLTEDQMHGAVDGGFKAITDPQSPAYWAATMDIPTLEATAGITLDVICQGLKAGRESRFYEQMRSIKYLTVTDIRFISLNVEAAEAKMGITLIDLRNAIAAAS